MNYRVCQESRLIVEMVAWASIQEKDKSGPNWRQARYQEQFYPDGKGELPIYIPEPATAKSGWNTLLSFDELSQMLANNVVFTGCDFGGGVAGVGARPLRNSPYHALLTTIPRTPPKQPSQQTKCSFEESRIRFPPSYRRKRGAEGDCGDYTDTARVSGAFTTQIAAEGEAQATGVRPPSYTDRILAHSLEDRTGFLRRGPYELCDAVRGSDHRPVSQAFFLKVNAALDGEAAIGDLIPMRLVVSDVSSCLVCDVWMGVWVFVKGDRCA